MASPSPEPEDMVALREQLVELAMQVASMFDVELDYSIESVRQVERILSEFHDELRESGDEEGLSGIALEFAAYLIAVIESHYEPGLWARNHPELGEDAFAYEWNGSTLFPFDWCLKRIYDGPGDDVWAKFETIVLTPMKRRGVSPRGA